MVVFCGLLTLTVEAEEMSRLSGAVPNLFDESIANSFAKGNDLLFRISLWTTFGDANGGGLKEWSSHLLGQHIFHNFFLQNDRKNDDFAKTLSNSKIFLGTDTSPLSLSLTECYSGIYDTGFFTLSQDCRDRVRASVITVRRESFAGFGGTWYDYVYSFSEVRAY